jgi:hypothetical protein
MFSTLLYQVRRRRRKRMMRRMMRKMRQRVAVPLHRQHEYYSSTTCLNP